MAGSENELNYKFTTTSDTKAAEKVTEQQDIQIQKIKETTAAVDKLTEADRRQAKSAQESASAFVGLINARSAGPDAIDNAAFLNKQAHELGNAKKAADEYAKAQENLADAAKGAAVAIAAAIPAALIASVNAFAEHQTAVFSLDAALAQSGQLTDDYRAK